MVVQGRPGTGGSGGYPADVALGKSGRGSIPTPDKGKPASRAPRGNTTCTCCHVPGDASPAEQWQPAAGHAALPASWGQVPGEQLVIPRQPSAASGFWHPGFHPPDLPARKCQGMPELPCDILLDPGDQRWRLLLPPQGLPPPLPQPRSRKSPGPLP